MIESSAESCLPIELALGSEVLVLSRAFDIENPQFLKIASKSSINIIVGPSNSYEYSIQYGLYRDGNLLSSVSLEEQDNKPLGAIQSYLQTPELDWEDTPSAGSGQYELKISVSGSNLLLVTCNTRALNIQPSE
ncbi:hypothetical protein [Shimazuella alba]|uniref:Uncharacterized protein n=1 Tax=Shimazuella alba TaxID=2690964 RepID=A0A6I4VSC5_9BACL|nr:hypothetical protein [Shimazuella alba]MXQ52710.1 hypothetical protein [Shimazuella alba]